MERTEDVPGRLEDTHALFLLYAARLARPRTSRSARNSSSGILRKLGLSLFACPRPIFGLQHFLYASFIATLILAWIPARLFFAYFTGVAFLAAAAAMPVGTDVSLLDCVSPCTASCRQSAQWR